MEIGKAQLIASFVEILTRVAGEVLSGKPCASLDKLLCMEAKLRKCVEPRHYGTGIPLWQVATTLWKKWLPCCAWTIMHIPFLVNIGHWQYIATDGAAYLMHAHR